MSDTPSAELFTELAHREGGSCRGMVKGGSFQLMIRGGWVDPGQLNWINQFF